MSTETADAAFTVARLPVISDERARATRESGRVAGYAAGWAEGSRAAAAAAEEAARRRAERAEAELAALREQFTAAVGVLSAAAQAAAKRIEPVLGDARATLLTRSVELAHAVVGVELADDARSARAAITRALAVPMDVEPVAIRLSERDLAALEAGLALCQGQVKLPDDVRLIADSALTPGDAISEYDGGFLDARVELAFERARLALADLDEQVR